MDKRLNTWKREADCIWALEDFDFRAAGQLAADIARESEEPSLRDRAMQASPSLRSAAAKGADRWSRDVARRRFGTLRDCLHALSGPRFGQRNRQFGSPTIDEEHRRKLNLPLGRRLFGPEIKEAYKRAAKRVHPDAGGNERAFQELSDARDALLKRL